MAITTSISSPSLSPLLFSKTHRTYFPRLDPHHNFCKFNRCCLQTVSSRQNPLCLSSSGTWVLNASLVRAEASGNGREPMVPPYNVLITGSTKGRLHSFVFFSSHGYDFMGFMVLGCVLLICLWFSLIFISGIGYALAKEFLKAGDNVIICSRSGIF